MKIHIQGTNLWYDSEEALKQREFYQQKEKEYWGWCFSGQRTIDLFGVEGARRILEIQAREERKLLFNHRSRGKL